MTQIDGKLWVIAQLSMKAVGLMMVSPVFWLTIWFTYRYYLKYEWDKTSAGHLALVSSLEGIGAGFLVICLTACLGLVIQPSIALYCMGPVSMLLSLWRPRFLCMSYGAGIIIAFFEIVHIPVDVIGITCLVAALHMAEGVLVLLFGGNHTVTIYRQSRKKLLAGSGIYRFWPVPVCLLILLTGEMDAGIHMPTWWPLLLDGSSSAANLCGLLPIAVTLGYSDLSGRSQEVKRRQLKNGILIVLYAILLLGISLTASRWTAGRWIAVGWMVLGHEAIVLYSKLLFCS